MNEARLLHMRQIFSQPHTLVSSNETFNLSAPKINVKYILAYFLQAQKTGPGKSPSDFSDGFTGSVDNAHSETINTTGAGIKICGWGANKIMSRLGWGWFCINVHRGRSWGRSGLGCLGIC